MQSALRHFGSDGNGMKIRGIIFDLDGTLFDTMGIWETAGEEYLASLGLVAKDGLSKQLSAMSLAQAAHYLKENYAIALSVNEITNGINQTVEDFYLYRAEPKENAADFLSVLKGKGIPMCIATATDRYLVEAALKRCDLLGFFTAIFTCSAVGQGKDQPHIFEAALAHLGTGKGETAVFEDAYHAAQTAKNAGFPVIGIYDPYEKCTGELKALADAYFSSFKEADKLLHI